MAYSIEEFKAFIRDNHIQGVICNTLVRRQFEVDSVSPVVVKRFRPDQIGQFLVQSPTRKGWTSTVNVLFKTSRDSPIYIANQTKSTKQKGTPKIMTKEVTYGPYSQR